jgi:hypothetical protein
VVFIFQRTALFIVTAAKISYLTKFIVSFALPLSYWISDLLPIRIHLEVWRDHPISLTRDRHVNIFLYIFRGTYKCSHIKE